MPRQHRAIKEGVKKKDGRAEHAGEIPAISRDEPKAKERADFFSPTENHQKSINPPKPKLTEAPNTTILIAPPK